MHTHRPNVTLILTQRERFSLTRPSLESILADYDAYPFQLIYVDGNSPPHIASYLRETAEQYPFMTLIRKEQYLRSNVARNLALPLAQDANYIAFLDNDDVVEPGWLEKLVACAEEEKAGVVTPLTLQGQPGSPDIEVHVAGIETKMRVQNSGRRWFQQKQLLYAHKLREVEHLLTRTTVDSVEFHCILIRRDILAKIELDELFDSLASHTDLCHQVQDLGWPIFIEPSARVIFLNPRQINGFEPTDVPFYRFKWSEPYVKAVFKRCVRKWYLAKDDPSFWAIWKWVIQNRQLPAKLATADDSLERTLLDFCQKRWCPPMLRTVLENIVLKRCFPKDGVPSNLQPWDCVVPVLKTLSSTHS